ncbi:hypothetical protein EJ06DRAFT_557959 [Trichodelitschia bisporula]|uniref:Uncharacterized protein n=1 Tax=Trichodelitschia bisporula TaxID=703511 RepID=A0A6G1HSR1_9PEZI|nr:hypothetical protein EJ06DRAFT_557959 [Trichodelitschia bisporula]
MPSQSKIAGANHNPARVVEINGVKWELVFVHTAACNECLKKNTAIMHRCLQCVWTICANCKAARDGSLWHRECPVGAVYPAVDPALLPPPPPAQGITAAGVAAMIARKKAIAAGTVVPTSTARKRATKHARPASTTEAGPSNTKKVKLDEGMNDPLANLNHHPKEVPKWLKGFENRALPFSDKVIHLAPGFHLDGQPDGNVAIVYAYNNRKGVRCINTVAMITSKDYPAESQFPTIKMHGIVNEHDNLLSDHTVETFNKGLMKHPNNSASSEEQATTVNYGTMTPGQPIVSRQYNAFDETPCPPPAPIARGLGGLMEPPVFNPAGPPAQENLMNTAKEDSADTDFTEDESALETGTSTDDPSTFVTLEMLGANTPDV